jgi:hypothetical protein
MMRWLGYTAGGTAACIAYTIPQIHDWAVAWLLVDALVWIGLMLLVAQFIELRREVAPPRLPGRRAKILAEDHDEWRRRIDAQAARRRYERHREQRQATILGSEWEVAVDHNGAAKSVRRKRDSATWEDI